MTFKVAVIGAGVNGLSSAIQILEYYKNDDVEVTIISDKFSPNTTSDVSAGLWGPFLMGSTDENKIIRWSKRMHDFLEKIWLSEDSGRAGVCLIPVFRITTSQEPLNDFWQDIVYGFKKMNAVEIAEVRKNTGINVTHGVRFITYTSEPIKLLPYMMERYIKSGGKIITKKISDLIQFVKESEYDCIINCTGLGSNELIKNSKVYPIRGQISRVSAPWMYYVILDESDDGNYIIPNCDNVILGGTHQEHDYNLNADPNDKKFIIEGCRELVKGLKKSPIVQDLAGLRPARSEVRLEKEMIDGKIVIHNYGHGGSGVTLCWGCGTDVLELLKSSSKL